MSIEHGGCSVKQKRSIRVVKFVKEDLVAKISPNYTFVKSGNREQIVSEVLNGVSD